MNKDILYKAIDAALKAGVEILSIYNDAKADFQIERKSDQSPLTIADKKAHAVIVSQLSSFQIPILSEEGKAIPFEKRENWDQFWVVDPLDGTKEFIKKNGEFTVNIALLQNNVPTLGVIYIPVQKVLYFASSELGAYKYVNISNLEGLSNLDLLISNATKLPVARKNRDEYVIVASRSHLSEETQAYISELEKQHNHIQLVSAGSSIKICWVAEGIADVYPRFAPTMEWDTAAGHAIILAAGKQIVKALTPNEALEYNKEDLLNPWFIVK